MKSVYCSLYSRVFLFYIVFFFFLFLSSIRLLSFLFLFFLCSFFYSYRKHNEVFPSFDQRLLFCYLNVFVTMQQFYSLDDNQNEIFVFSLKKNWIMKRMRMRAMLKLLQIVYVEYYIKGYFKTDK